MAMNSVVIRKDGFVEYASCVLGIVKQVDSGWFAYNIGIPEMGPFNSQSEAVVALCRPAEVPEEALATWS